MHRNDFEPHLNQPDTYQTGVTEPAGKKASGLIAVLLILTIFLGGLAGGLGVLNIRLLQRLQEAGSTVPVDIYTQSSATEPAEADLDSSDPAPAVPTDSPVRLQLYQPSSHSENPVNLSPAEVYAQNRQALVTLQATTEHETGKGLGLVIDASGYILTNASLVDAADRIYVQTSTGQVYRAALVGADSLTDMAVLYIQAEGLTAASFCTSEYLQEDDPITVIQYGSTEPSSGFITNARRQVSLGQHSLELIKTSFTGCDGPIFNRCGQVIAMNSSSLASLFSLHTKQGISYAVPSVTIKAVVDQLIAAGSVSGRPDLGVETVAISKVYQKYWNLPGGLRLVSVSQEAAQQGLQADDILLALGGARLTCNEDLQRILYSNPIGSSLTAVVFRDGESITLSLTIFDTAA